MLKDGKAIRAAYLAGPMRSKPEFNYPAFMSGAEALRSIGWFIHNPAEMDVLIDEQPDNFLDMTVEEQEAHAGAFRNARRYAARDTHVIIHLLRAEDGDAIIVLPDWEESTGARAEVAVAEWVGLKFLTIEEALEPALKPIPGGE
jgi:hypothetical protein